MPKVSWGSPLLHRQDLSDGRFDEGTTVTDWMVQERERGITVRRPPSPVNGVADQIESSIPPVTSISLRKSSAVSRVLDGGVVVFDGRRSRAAVRDRVASGESLWCATHLFCQQNGSCGGRLLAHHRYDPRSAHGPPLPVQLPMGSEDLFWAWWTSSLARRGLFLIFSALIPRRSRFGRHG